MTTLAEEARWAKLSSGLEERFDSWGLQGAEWRAKALVRDLRRSGWRVPLPDFQIRNETPRGRPPLRPETVRKRAQECREALRKGS